MVTNQNSIRKKLELLLNKLNKKKKYKIPLLIIRSAFGELRIEESRINEDTPSVSLQKFFKSKFWKRMVEDGILLTDIETIISIIDKAKPWYVLMPWRELLSFIKEKWE